MTARFCTPFPSVTCFFLDHREAKYFPQEEYNVSWKDSLSPDGLLVKTLPFKHVQIYSCYQTWWGSWHISLLSLMTQYLTCLWESSILILCMFWAPCFKKNSFRADTTAVAEFFPEFHLYSEKGWNCFLMFRLLPLSVWWVCDSGWSGLTSLGSLKS